MEDDEEEEPSAEAKAPQFSFQNITDFEKFTEGMDDAGSSEGEEEGADEDEDDEDDAGMEEGSEEEEEEEEEYGSENHDDGKETKDSEDDGGVLTFSRAQESDEVEKGKAVRNQLGLCMFAVCLQCESHAGKPLSLVRCCQPPVCADVLPDVLSLLLAQLVVSGVFIHWLH